MATAGLAGFHKEAGCIYKPIKTARTTLFDMSPLDQSPGLPLDNFAVIAPDWPAALPAPHAVPRVVRPAGTWAVRRALVRGYAALITMKLDEVAKTTSHLSSLLSELPRPKRERYAPVLRALDAALHVALDQLPGARGLLTALPTFTTDPVATLLLRYLDWKRGKSDQETIRDTVDYLVPPVGGRVILRIFSLCVSAAFAFDGLHLTVSSSLASEALELARKRYGNQSAMCLLPATLLAQVAYEQGRFEEAEALLRPRISLIRSCGMLDCVARASIVLARISLHRGQRRFALATLREAEAVGHTRRWPRLVALATSEYARILSVTRTDEGRIHDLNASGRSALVTGLARTTAQLELSSHLRQAPVGAEVSGSAEPHGFAGIESALHRACLAAENGQFNDGCRLLLQCLRLGATHGLRMIFVDAGPLLVTTLERIYDALAIAEARPASLRPYIATLLRCATPVGTEEPEPPTYRPLSRRETVILEMVAGGLSNKRIAQALGITPETVKSHAKNIFVKLDTRTRAQAVARAESIGLL